MSFKITILGSSGALPAYGRFPSSQLVEIQNRMFLVDCGEGTQIQMMKYQVNFHRISHIFISHLHGDHYLGLMGLLFTMHLQRRTNDLHIHSHWGLDDIITTHLQHSHGSLSFKIHFHGLEEGVIKTIVEDAVITVETIPLHHRVKCSGFLFREKPKPRRIDKDRLPEGLRMMQIANLKKGEDVLDDDGNVLYKNHDLTLPPRRSRSYAYCSDTGYNEDMVSQIKEVNMLYHEATFMAEEADKAEMTLHSTATQAAQIAALANVTTLLIGHFSARYRELEPVLNEAMKVFASTRLAVEGETFSIKD